MWSSSDRGVPVTTDSMLQTEGRHVRGHDTHAMAGTTTSVAGINEVSKSLQYDSHSDSGFLSGTNLMSGCSVDGDCSTSSGLISPAISTDNHPILPPHNSESSSQLQSSELLDSGIDISDQMSSLQLRSGPQIYEDNSNQQRCSSSSNTTEEDSRGGRSDDLNISQSHVSLLREIFSPDKDGDTQLHVAVMRGFIEVVYQITRLLPHQAFLDLTNNTGRTALHLAVSAGLPSIVRHLVVCGASPVARDLRGNTPLHVACARKQPEIVTHLTRPVTVTDVINSQLNYRPTHTPGLLAADLNNYQGETCVHVAAMAGDREILQYLTWYGADVNAKECRSGRTALHFAVEARDPELVAHIVNVCRASVTVETYARLSPYQLALANGATGIATQLLDLGAPAQLLPAAFTRDDEDDYEEDAIEYNQESNAVTATNGWQEVDDIRLAGVAVRSSLNDQATGLLPVSTAPHTINADIFY